MKFIKLALGIGVIMLLLMAACGRDDGDDIEVGTASGSVADSTDPCEAETLESSDIGISSSTISVVVMADIGSALAPGLFQGSIDGTKAWADYVNSQGGLACRNIEVIEHDSAINPVETTNGFKEACENAIAMVGSTSLFVTDIDDLETCEDGQGNAIGIADFAERTVSAVHSCSPNAFTISGVNGSCPLPTPPETSRLWAANLGIDNFLIDRYGDDLHGVFLIPGDLIDTTQTAMVAIRAAARISGIKNDGEFNVSGSDAQATYGQFLATMTDSESNIARTGSDDQSMLKWRREALAQGGFEDVIWNCSLACYNRGFVESPEAEGTYLWISFLPFEERDHNEELDLFMSNIGTETPVSWSAGAWAMGRLFEQVINDIVDQYGVNGITRQRVLDTAKSIDSFNANGWFGDIDFTSKPNLSPCIVVLQVQSGEFVRQHPAEPGTLDCDPDAIVELELDASAEASNGPQEIDKR